ncbi:hypothetical protein GQ44DRAFT_755382 [Phaeosphaeriaceae sp. PMI808]|nr:hypothetical protein GQ44DRAFT_755382 [Phaeosphaeriaceae sp. PMI808]
MNTVKSVYYGWATLIVAGGGAYVFAKRSINADRAQKAELDRQKRNRIFQMEQEHLHGGAGSGMGGGARGAEESGNPSVQASRDPAATRHEPVDEAGAAREKSKYEASDVYRTRKGDRFS